MQVQWLHRGHEKLSQLSLQTADRMNDSENEFKVHKGYQRLQEREETLHVSDCERISFFNYIGLNKRWGKSFSNNMKSVAVWLLYTSSASIPWKANKNEMKSRRERRRAKKRDTMNVQRQPRIQSIRHFSSHLCIFNTIDVKYWHRLQKVKK